MIEQNRTSPCRRILALLLCLCLCFTLLPANVLAVESEIGPTAVAGRRLEQGEQPETIDTPDGEIPVEKDWDETYPYGTFAFGTYQADVGEPGAKTKDGEEVLQTILIPVYRIGGTTGRADVRITYAPAVTTNASGETKVYDYAASGKSDLLIEIEDASPLAFWQDYALPLEEREMQRAEGVAINAKHGEDNSLTLSLEGAEEAAEYRWQYKGAAGGWKDVEGGVEAVLPLTTDDYSAMGITGWEGLDFRCILTVDDALFCTISLKGETFKPYEAASAAPEGLAAPEEPSYTAVEFDDDYDIYEFTLTFADGETVKYLRVTALDDEAPELPELGLFTIVGCEGGECSDLCNTLTLMISDNDEAKESEVFFEVSAITVDRADGVACVLVRRTGGTTYNVTVDYETVDGTAKAGVDYAAKKGTLAFVGSIDEIKIPVELISNDDTGKKTFSLKLSNLRGGGTGELCSLLCDTVTFTLTGSSPKGEAGQNLATVLSGNDGTDVSDRVDVSDDALIPDRETQNANVKMPGAEPIGAEFVLAEPSGERSYSLSNSFKFTRGANYASDNNYWHDWEIVAGCGDGLSDYSNSVDYNSLFKRYVYDYQTKQYVMNTTGKDKNGNVSYVNAISVSDSSQPFSTFLEIEANFKGWVEFMLLYAGKQYDQLQYATRLSSVGTKVIGTALEKDYYLRPDVSLAGSKNVDHFVTANYDFKDGKHRYYWYSKGISGSTWQAEYGADRNSDTWDGTSSIVNTPLAWNETLSMETHFTIAKQWSLDGNVDGNEIMGNSTTTTVQLGIFRLHRRVFTKTNSIPVVIYTPNDNDEAQNNHWSPLPTNSDFYNTLKTSLNQSSLLTLVSGESGITANGQLYVGSAFIVDSTKLPAAVKIPENGLFVTRLNSDGSQTRVGTVEPVAFNNTNEATKWKITMMWDGITESDMSASYQLNMMLERRQTISVDLTPSIPSDGTAMDAYNLFSQKGITVSYSALEYDTTGYPKATNGMYYGTTLTADYAGSKWSSPSSGVTSIAEIKNIQAIQFNLDPEDVILYDGRAYPGNATITVSATDLASPVIQLIYYKKDYLTAISKMGVLIKYVELYYDGDGNNKITGSPNGIGGFTPSGGDVLVDSSLKGDYPETDFKPVISVEYNEDGTVKKTTTHQYFLKVYFSLRPRCLVVPSGASEDDTAQILPAFASAITDATAFAALTPEQQSYRYIDGANTDGYVMYGAPASAGSYVDIPLGGDIGSIKYESHTEAVKDKNGKITGANTVETYTWTPEYLGSLVVPFKNPAPVIDTNNITGGPVPIAGKQIEYNASTKKFDYSSNNVDHCLDKINAFLGAMVGRSTFVLGVQQQKKALSAIDSLSEIDPETLSVSTVATIPNADSVMNLGSGGDPGESGGGAPGDDAGYPEFSADLGTELPSLELDLGDYATLIMDGYQVGFAIGIPIYKYEDTNYSGSEQSHPTTDGSTHTSHVDENGNTIDTITSKDGKTKTETTTKPDLSDPNKRTVVCVEEKTDENGKKDSKTTTKQQEKKTDPKTKKETWETVDEKTEDTKPPAPSQDKTKGEKFKEGFGEANGGMQTLANFIKACNTHQFDKLKDFFSGAFEDDSLKNAKNGNCTSTKVEVSFTVQLSLMFEFNPIDNCHYFKQAGISASLGIELSMQHRFSAFPLAYVYVKLGIEVEVAVSLSCIRNPKLGQEITSFRQGSLSDLSNGQPLVFELNMKKHKIKLNNGLIKDEKFRGFHIDLLGTVYMEIFDNPNLTGDALDAGTISGDGTEKEVLLKAYGKVVYIRLTPLKGLVVADNIRPVVGASSKVVFDGLSITPSLSLEAGVGIGIELLKFEIFVKTSFAITMTMGGYLEETDSYEGFYISSFEWGLCLGFNVTALFFNYTMEAIGISVSGEQHGTGGYFSWEIAATAVDGNYTLWSKDTYTAADGKPLGTEEPEPPEDNNIGPLDTEFGYTFGGFPNDAAWGVAQPLTMDTDGNFPSECGWVLKENVRASEWWYGGVFKGEIPQDGDLCKATRNNVWVDIPVPAGTGEIKVYFDGKMDIQCVASGYTASGVKKTPAKIPVGDGEATVRLILTKGTLLDRWVVPEKESDQDSSGNTTANAGAEYELIHVTAPTDVSKRQCVTRAGEEERAIEPTGTTDFQLSGFNTSGDAKKLVSGLSTGYSYKLFQANGENYILYPLMLEGTAQLVLSKIVMTDDLTQASGVEHPTDPNASEPWLKVDNDELGDLDYNVSVNGKTITVVWTAYKNLLSATDAASPLKNAKNVVVKRASLTLGKNTAFTQPKLLASDVGPYRFLPAQADSTAVWAEGLYTDSGEGTLFGSVSNDRLAVYLLSTNDGLSMEMLQNRTTTNGLLATAVYRWVVQSDLNAISGDGSRLVSSTGFSVDIEGENIENIELGNVGGKTLALYSTSKTAYFDGSLETPVTVEPTLDPVLGELRFPKDTDLATIRRLYLRELTDEGWGDALLLETVVDFDGCNDDNIESRTLKDGVYAGSALQTAQADPYFGNLSFLQAVLSVNDNDETEAEPEDLILFEMGGNSYLLKQEETLSLLSGGQAEILPIFEQTTGTDVAIGSDGVNLAVVYTAAVPNSPSNAIWAAWWDTNIGGWGSPTILAMRNLQVYEDSIKYDLEPEEQEKAFLGKQTGNAAYDAYIASLTEEELAEVAGSMDRLYFSDLQMSTRSVDKGKQLLVLTMGSMQALKEHQIPLKDGSGTITGTISSAAPDGDAVLNFYAIAFGVGEQALGEGNLSLGNYDFSIGSKLVGEVSFVNTGTTAIRGSKDNPITVTLYADEYQKVTGPDGKPQEQRVSDLELAHWYLKESIRSGASMKLGFLTSELTSTLKAGTRFRIEVREDASYFGSGAFQAEIPDLLIIQELPDLSISAFTADLKSVDTTSATLDISVDVINNGTLDANTVFLQFAYDTGSKDANGLPIYRPVDIRGSVLVTSAQAEPEKSPKPLSQDLEHGVYKLHNQNDGDNLKKGYYRTVSGTLKVPVSCFVNTEDLSGLHLRVEAYSGGDYPDWDDGLYASEHNEYNGVNNASERIVKHRTDFNVPAYINTALGTTLTMPVTYASTSSKSELVLTEISDGSEGWEPLMGICYYDPVQKIIVAAPNAKAQTMLAEGKTPTGILQIKDTATNSIAAITFTVGSMAKGVNIYKDDASFSFRDKNGVAVALDAAAASNPAWVFLDRSVEIGWTGGDVNEIPMNRDLTMCNQDDAYFTFETVADSITLYFMGEVTVTSDVFSVTANPVNTSKPSPVKFSFTKNGQGNETGMKHTVRISAKQGTKIDRYVAVYKTNTVPETDPAAPQILWNRSFPDTASLKPGKSVPMTCYILDGTGLQSVFFNNQPLSETTTPKLVKVDENFWYFDYTFTQNGPYSVRAQDLSGNSSGNNFSVNWFNDVTSLGAIATAPGLVRNHLSFVKADGSALPSSGTVDPPLFLKSSYTPDTGEDSTAYLFADGIFSGDPLGKTDQERWLANWNGYYLVRVDKSDGTWARAIARLTQLNDTPPDTTPGLSGNGTPDAPYLIGSRNDWLKLRTYVANDNSTVGMCFLQTADFTITEADRIASSTRMFRGVYDGGGHTLTFNSTNGPKECAPFWYVDNATFRNLRVDGTVNTTLKFAAGIAANAFGLTNFYNCRVSLTINSNISGSDKDGTHGGLVAYTPVGSTLNITGCTVDGSFLGVTTLCGGFVGYSRGVLVMTDCLFAPKAWEWTDSQNFYRWRESATRTLTNCYYLAPNANNQGTRGWKVLPGENVALDFGGGTTYDVAGITACTTGLAYQDFLIAGQGEAVSMTPRYTGDPEEAEPVFEASDGRFENTRSNVWTLTMPAKDVTITMPGHVWGEPWYEWSEDNGEVTAYVLCEHTSSHVKQETVSTSFYLTKPSTFEYEGSGYFLATFKDSRFAQQRKDIVIPPVMCEGGANCPSAHFTDMPPITNYAHIPIDWAVVNRITFGLTPTTFGPKKTVTRAQFVTFLWGVFGKPEPTSTESPFTDVKPGKYYYKAVLWAVENGITSGTGNGKFSPNGTCIREQVVSFLWRASGCPDPITTENPFTDVKPGKYYYKAVLWALENKITSGVSATAFGPKNSCTRAQVVAFLYKQFGQ